MDGQQARAAADSGDSDIPTFEELAADPAIAALLEFDPAPRQNKRKDGWTAPLQKRFIAHLARTGSPNLAAEAVGRNRYGVEKVYKSAGAEGFAAAWDGAVALFEEREAGRLEAVHAPRSGERPPGVDRRRKSPPMPEGPRPGEVMNEYGEWEDEASLNARADEARDNITAKLLRCRRMYLAEICDSPGKRAAFEILTELEIDWERAARLEPQEDEPWRQVSMREPDMLLPAENGWMNDCAHAIVPDRMAQLREALDKHYAEHGLPEIEWGEEARKDQQP